MILSADDFGISPAVSRGIFELIANGKINATSCMVTNPLANDDLKKLASMKPDIDIGLHLVLTDEKPHRTRFRTLATRAYLGRLDRRQIYTEITAQILKFKNIFGCEPDFIDGHQHVHQLPMIREALLQAYDELKLKSYVRIFDIPTAWLTGFDGGHSVSLILGACAIRSPGRALAKLLDERGIRHNRYLMGHYDYQSKASFRSVCETYLERSPQAGDIFMCHPGYVDDDLKSRDAMTDARQENLDFMLSPEFDSLLTKTNVSLNRFEP